MEYVMTEAIDNVGIGQADYMKLFMQELTYQDPLKPVDNREFMAQMAQFSALQQAVSTSESVANLLEATYDNRVINLLGKYVLIEGEPEYLQVKSVSIKENKIAEIRVSKSQDNANSFTITKDKIIEIS
jgi:flagellar basal-body rod modification protein FlgD